jgi:hypothetical protein
MKKITKRNKVKVSGVWDDIGMEVWWHPKSDFIFFLKPPTLKQGDDLEFMGEFGKLAEPLKMTIDKRGNACLDKITPIDIAILKLKMDRFGFKNYTIKDNSSGLFTSGERNSKINFKTKDEKAMFQVYFSDFIVDG